MLSKTDMEMWLSLLPTVTLYYLYNDGIESACSGRHSAIQQSGRRKRAL